MRIIYTDSVVLFDILGYDGYGQPIPGKVAKQALVKWKQEEDNVTIIAPFPIPSGVIFWYGNLTSYKSAVKTAPAAGINLWKVTKPSFEKDVIGRIAYFMALLTVYQQTNLGTVP